MYFGSSNISGTESCGFILKEEIDSLSGGVAVEMQREHSCAGSSYMLFGTGGPAMCY